MVTFAQALDALVGDAVGSVISIDRDRQAPVPPPRIAPLIRPRADCRLEGSAFAVPD